MVKKIVKHSSIFVVTNLVIIIIGIYSYFNLKIQLLPQLPPSKIYVSISYPGVKADLVEKQITKPFEEVFSNVEGLSSIISSSEIGESRITLAIKPGFSITNAINQIRDLILKNKSVLPEGALDPIVSMESFSSQNMMYISVNTKNNNKVSSHEITSIRNKLKYVEGVASSSVFGLPEKAVYIELYPDKISKYYIPLDGILASLTLGNSEFSGGKISNQYKTEYISFNSNVKNIKDFNNINLESNKLPIKLKSIADVSLKEKEKRNKAYLGNKEVLLIGITPKTTANPVDVSKNITTFFDNYEKKQSNLTFKIIIDDSRDILQAFYETNKTLIEAILLVSAIIFLLMGSLKFSFIAILAIPVSLSGCLIMLLLSGYSINTITMLAMVLSIGLVVDDSIVVIEEAEKHYHKSKNNLESIITAMKSLFLSVLILMLTLVVIYIPVIFIKGEIGKIMQEFALTVTSCLIMSFVVAFTLTPVMFYKLVKNPSSTKFSRKITDLMNWVTIKYKKSLIYIFKYYKIFLFVIFIITSIGMYVGIKKISFNIEPFEQKDIILVTNTFQPNTNLTHIDYYMNKIVNSIKNNNNIKYILRIDESPRSTIWLILKNRTIAKKTLNEVNDAFSKIAAGGDLSAKIDQSKNAGSSDGTHSIMFYISNPNSMSDVWNAAQYLQERSHHLFSDFVTISASPIQDFNISCNNDKLFKYGLNQKNISDILDALLNSRKIGTFKQGANNYDVIVKSKGTYIEGLHNISNMEFTTQKKGDNIIKLKDICKINRVGSFNQILRYNEQYAIEAEATTKKGIKLKSAINLLDQLNKELQNDSTISYTDQTLTLIESESFFIKLIAMGIIGLYLLMFARFNMLSMPLVILSAIPPSISVSLISLYLSKGSLNIYTEISILTLAGLITKHSVLICSAIKSKNTLDGIRNIISGTTSRIRAILITSSAMSIGLISLFFDTGNYANSRFQMAVVLVSGIVLGSIIVVYVVPVMFFLVMKLVKKRKNSH